ncbi:hypothetical protein [Massilia genomosp. 1]|uniref:MFS transporter n=1 Tax=Massilia genomosp. 1 TaxID=2609280 RepID=A0ABX0MJP8_9BURK|nr:hypothetical protein [Massilia genomosp. 1]NHZ63016.1 hypothetical protein [Massilia genomosp. 1]
MFIVLLCALAGWLVYLCFSIKRGQLATPPAPANPPRSYALAMLACLLSLALGLFGTFYIPAYQMVLESFGPSVPRPTAWMLSAADGFWIPGLCTIGVLAGYRKSRQYPAIFGAVCLLQMMLFVCVMWVLSLPIVPLC